jgi:hypothetical protein
MTDLSQVTYCGLYCGLCASRNRIPPAAQALREQMTRAGWPFWGKQVPGFEPFWAFLDDLTASGADCSCREKGCGPGFCGIRRCARERGVEVCALCDDYPCDRIQALGKGYVTLIADGQRLREIGLDAWIAEQERRVQTGFCYADIRCEPYQVPDW